VGGEETSLRTLAEAVRSITWPGEVLFSGVGRRGDPARWRADVTALRALGASIDVPLHEGLRQVSEWARASRGASDAPTSGSSP
jgi:UDP-glucose 4-epimerase